MENGAILMLLAHLLHNNTAWRNNPIRMLRVVEKEEARHDVEQHIIDLGASSRITITTEVIVSKQPAPKVIQSASKNAAIVMLGFQPPEEGAETELYQRMETIAGELPRVLFVSNAGGMALES